MSSLPWSRIKPLDDFILEPGNPAFSYGEPFGEFASVLQSFDVSTSVSDAKPRLEFNESNDPSDSLHLGSSCLRSIRMLRPKPPTAGAVVKMLVAESEEFREGRAIAQGAPRCTITRK
jgi:hypothetical protein